MNPAPLAYTGATTPLEINRKYPVSYSIGSAIILYSVFFTLVWIILWTFNPGMVQDATNTINPTGPDASRCFVAALIIALIICVIIWLFMRVC